LVGIFALWGNVRAYEVNFELDLKQESTIYADKITIDGLSGSAIVRINGETINLNLAELNLAAPSSKDQDAEEWALDWIGENIQELIEVYARGIDPDLAVTEIDLKKHKLRCRGKTEAKCVGEIKLSLSVTRS